MAEAHHQEWLDDDMMPDYADVQTLSSAANENAWFRKSFKQFGGAVDRMGRLGHAETRVTLASRGLGLVAVPLRESDRSERLGCFGYSPATANGSR